MLTDTILRYIINTTGTKSYFRKLNLGLGLLHSKLAYSQITSQYICRFNSCSIGVMKTLNYNTNKSNMVVKSVTNQFQTINERHFTSHKGANLSNGLCLHCRSLQLLYEQKRNKFKSNKKNPEYDSESDSEEEDNVQGSKLITFRTETLRMDGILKKALGVARNKLEAQFYGGNIRVNGRKPDKKSFQLRIGDEVDLIKGLSPMNPEFLSVSRIEVVSVKEAADEDSESQLIIKVRRTKTMYIENYEESPWKKTTTAE